MFLRLAISDGPSSQPSLTTPERQAMVLSGGFPGWMTGGSLQGAAASPRSWVRSDSLRTQAFQGLCSIPSELHSKWAGFLDVPELARLAPCSKVSQAIASNQELWTHLLQLYLYSRPAYAGIGADAPREQFRAHTECEGMRGCLQCGRGQAVVPVVYGFPTPGHIMAAKAGRLALGGDMLFRGSPMWVCRYCQSEWQVYPWRTPPFWVQDRVRMEAQ